MGPRPIRVNENRSYTEKVSKNQTEKKQHPEYLLYLFMATQQNKTH